MLIHAGALPLDTDLLNIQRFVQAAFGNLIQATLGTNALLDGFTCIPTTPPSLAVQVTPGTLFALEAVDSAAFGTLVADIVDQVMKIATLPATENFTLVPPTTNGFSQNYLLQVAFSETDANLLVLDFFNPDNPIVPFTGPANEGTALNTQRVDRAVFSLKAGIAAATGTQATPQPDQGFIGVFVITVANGASAVTAANITTFSGSPFIPVRLPAVPAAVQNGTWNYAHDTGSANTVIASVNPVPVALVEGLCVSIKIAVNNTGASTLNLNGLGAMPIIKRSAGALVAGDLSAGFIAQFQFDGTSWQLLSR